MAGLGGPEGTRTVYDKILVAVDHSEMSDRAVVAARDLAVLSEGEMGPPPART
jgi:nucleotide-binding universal stress UspA family protein